MTITAHNLTGGQSYTPDPTAHNYRLLLCAVFWQAWRDARNWRQPGRAYAAQRWLRTPETMELAESIGVRLPGMVQP